MKHTIWERTTYNSGDMPEGIFLAVDEIFLAADKVFESADKIFDAADKFMQDAEKTSSTTTRIETQRVQLSGKRWATFKMLIGSAFEALFCGVTTIKFARRK